MVFELRMKTLFLIQKSKVFGNYNEHFFQRFYHKMGVEILQNKFNPKTRTSNHKIIILLALSGYTGGTN